MDFQELRNSDFIIESNIQVFGSRNSIKIGSGREIRLQPRQVSVLVFLCSQAGKMVSRQSLREFVWNDYYTGDLALNQAISKLRSLFKAEGIHDELIKTIPKKGYMLCKKAKRLNRNKYKLVAQRGFALIGLILVLAMISLIFSVNDVRSVKRTKEVYVFKSGDHKSNQKINKIVGSLDFEKEPEDNLEMVIKSLNSDSTYKISEIGESQLLIVN